MVGNEADLIIVRRRTLDWLCTNAADNGTALPDWLVQDIKGVVHAGRSTATPDQIGPILTIADHRDALVGLLNLPSDGQSATFWHTVVDIVHTMMEVEAQARVKQQEVVT